MTRSRTPRVLLLALVLSTALPALGQNTAGAEKLQQIVNRMRSRTVQTVWQDVTDLKMLPREMGDAVLELASAEKNEVVRLGLARAACNLGQEVDGGLLLARLADNARNAEVRLQAANCLGLLPQLFGNEQISDALRRAFADERDVMVKIAEARALWRLTNDSQFVRFLLDTANERDNAVAANEAALVLAENGKLPLVRHHLLRIFSDPTPQGERALMVLRNDRHRKVRERAQEASSEGDPNIDQALELMREILIKVRDQYVDEEKSADVKKMVAAAADRMVSTLDPFSGYLNEEAVRAMEEQLREHYGGIGAYVGMRNEIFTIISPIYGGPAYRAGLKSLDQVLEVDGKKTTELQFEKVISRLKGKPGTPVKVKIYRRGWTAPQEFTIIRGDIQTKSVQAALLPGNIGYVRLIRFAEHTADSLDEALTAMEKQGMQGLVLDLRDNPGGLLRSAVEVSDLFLPGDRLIVYSQGREGVARRRNFYTHADNTHPDLPMVVLINSGSASASEIVSGAMRDHNRATLIGETSYGKGSVQSILPLSSTHNLTRLRLTVAKYFLPLGDCIHGTGVDPDVTIEPENMPSWQVNKILELREKREVEDYVATLWQEALTPITSVMADGDKGLGSALRDLNGFNLKRYVNRAARATDTDDLRARTERFAALGRRLRNDAAFRQKILSTARADGWRPENPAADILDQLPSIRAHYLRHLTALAEGDGNDPSLYPGFDGFYDSLNAKVPDSFRDTVRREVRRQLRQRVADDRGEEFVYDLQEDLQLQRGVYEILEKLNMPSDQIEDYRTFPAKFTATAEKQPQGEEALK